MKFTILGSTGFIGQYLKIYCESHSYDCFTPTREYVPNNTDELGHVIYSIGLTADFREKPFETVTAHVCKLMEILRKSKFDSFLYLSSTRIYNGLTEANENSNCIVNSNDPSDLYNISKLMGESICLSSQNKNVRIARLSNVIGHDFESENFLMSIIKSAVSDGFVNLLQNIKGSKDYITIQNTAKILTNISLNGKHRIYNVASGFKVTNEQILEELRKHVNFKYLESNQTKLIEFPEISINRIQSELGFVPSEILKEIGQIVEQYKRIENDKN